MSCPSCGSPFPLSHFGDCRDATSFAIQPAPVAPVAAAAWPVVTVLSALDRMTEPERVTFFNELNEKFCFHCGSTDGRRCYCQRDD